MAMKHISGWVDVTGLDPVDPGYGNPPPPLDPGYGRPGWSPADPGYGHPDWAPARPGHDLPGGGGHVWGALIRWIMRPGINNDPVKPPGRPVIPSNELPPTRPPHIWGGGGGHWEPVDPGFGKPPLWGFVTGPDNGLPAPPAGPDNTLPGGGGTWVPTDPDYGKPVHGCPGDKPHPPIWAWIPDPPKIDNTLPGGGTGTGGTVTVTLYPASVTSLASGGSGSVNVTTSPTASPWAVEAASVPSWVTLTPMSATTDQNINLTYSVSANSTGKPKQAFVKVGNATLTINQGAV